MRQNLNYEKLKIYHNTICCTDWDLFTYKFCLTQQTQKRTFHNNDTQIFVDEMTRIYACTYTHPTNTSECVRSVYVCIFNIYTCNVYNNSFFQEGCNRIVTIKNVGNK